MARTFNRRPLSVNTPSSSDLKEHFFNHYNWKGMNVNKNFLAADQETFEECNNVYMNAEGILRSRPAIKQTDKNNIVKFWNFNNLNVYLIKSTSDYELVFGDQSTSDNSLTGLSTENVTLIPKDNKIFIFTTTSGKFSYYDTTERKIISGEEAESFIYVPITKSIADSNVKNVRSKNLLIDNQITSYIYSPAYSLPSSINGKNIKVTLDTKEYGLVFDPNTTPSVLYENKGYLPSNTNYLIKGAVSGTDVYIACKINKENDGVDPDGEFDLFIESIYSKIGSGPWILREKFSKSKQLFVPRLDNTCLGISDDGLLFYCSVYADRPYSGLYFLSTIKNEYDQYEYEYLTKKTGYSDGTGWHFCHVVSKDTYMNLYHSIKFGYGNAEIAINGSIITYYICNQAGEELRNVSLRSAYIIYDSEEGNFSGTLISNNTSYSFKIEESTSGGEDFIAYNEMSADGILPVGVSYKRKVSTVTSDGKYAIYDFVSDVCTEISEKYLYDSTNNSTLPNSAIRFSEDGTKLFLPKGVYFTNIDVFVEYLNLGEQDYAINHFGLNETIYSIRGDNAIYSNDIENEMVFTSESGGNINESFVSLIANGEYSELTNLYIRSGQELFISELETNRDGETLLYFPEINKQTFSSIITELQPISSTEMGVFLKDEIWYVSKQDGLYSSYKSKIESGVLNGSDVITSYDGTNVIFATERGLVALSYQNFVASTDQTLTYLSDAISEQFKEFVKHPVKLLRYQFWILAYTPELTTAYLLDLRNNSWWPMNCHSLPTEFYVVDNEVLLLSGNKLFRLDKSDENYYDYDGTKHQINWNFKSQKLHLNAVNYYKHISNLTLYSVLDTDTEMNFVMDVNNYRKQIDTTEIQTISYKVDTIRTFVKRVSYPKVNEFQYNMHQDDEREIRLPLSLSGITIKYKISGQVR